MDWNASLRKGLARTAICLLLIAGILLGLGLPGITLKEAKPEAPVEEMGIREIAPLQVGEALSQVNTISVPTGGSAAPTQPQEPDPEKIDPEETQPGETLPSEEASEEPDVEDGQQGNEDGNQGEEGGEELSLDLAAVMVWYRYGDEPKTLVCGPDRAVSKNLNTAQLENNQLEYDFYLKGPDAEFVKITSVSVAEGDGVYRSVEEEGSLDIRLPGGNGKRKYTFRLEALAEKQNQSGQWVEQEVSFEYVIQCSYFLDLQLELTWQGKELMERTVSCDPDKVAVFAVNSAQIPEGMFAYSVKLTGPLAGSANILEASYTTASGQESGTLETEEGTLKLLAAPGKDRETYYLSFTVETGERKVLYTYNLVYRQQLDVSLTFRWRDRGGIAHDLICQPGGSVSGRITNNKVAAGAVGYEMELGGTDGSEGSFRKISYTSEDGGGSLEPEGSLPVTVAEGSTSNTYRLTVQALVKGQTVEFEILLYYANDVTLEMTYTLREDGEEIDQYLSCENKKTKQAQTIYDDQLDGGILTYKMVIVGADSDSVSITQVSCYRASDRATLNLQAADTVELKLEGGKTGEHSFRIQAADDAGNEYNFTINIPYKHRGSQSLKITTNLDDTETIENGVPTNMQLKVWSEDAEGNVLGYVYPTGTDTKLTATLDGEELTYVSTSGVWTEYVLVPENPKVGDTNTHTVVIYAEDAMGNYSEKTLTLTGQRTQAGQKAGSANIYVDMTVLGLGVVGPVPYTVLSDEPVSYVVLKAILGQEMEEPFGSAEHSLGWSGDYGGTPEKGFYLRSLDTGYHPTTLEEENWPGDTEEAVLEYIDAAFGQGSGLATLWRCLYRNGLNKSGGSGGSFGEFDYTSGSGWIYSIGSTTYYPGQAMSAIYLKDGDVLTLRYTLAYGWDVGGGTPGYGSTVGYCITALNGNIQIHHQMEEVTQEDGSRRYQCRCCGLVQDCAHEHIQYQDLEDGTHICFCTDCNSTVGDAQEHNWITGTENGECHICQQCGAEENHIWKETEGSNTATCTEPGVHRVRCQECQQELEEETPARGHTFDNQWQYVAGEHYQTCSTCGEEHSRGQHEYGYDPEWEDYECRICKALHDFDVGCTGNLTVTKATCKKIIYHCSGCGYDLTQEGVFEEYHDFAQGICQVCGAEDPDYEPEAPGEHEHQYDTLVEEEASTCEEAGYRLWECQCGAQYEESLPLAEHSWSEWEITQEPDVGVEGEKYRYCLICNTEQTETMEALPEEGEVQTLLWSLWKSKRAVSST